VEDRKSNTKLVNIFMEDEKFLSNLKFSQRSEEKFKFSSELYQRTHFNANFSRENKNLPLKFLISQRHKEI
jgi:hypothetical protein